ncbi:MAG: YhdH/YhfP family quinone oxidoreductase [Methylocystaceae bacterium]|nr:YhdH/YhfP family quinone oxidoreductase [Methylocystaceae bacterium]
MKDQYQALVVRKGENRTFTYGIEACELENLPKGELTIRVAYSSINYKDLMSCQGNPAVTRRFPHTPGTDAAGEVIQSTSTQFKVGDKVLVYTYPMGMNHNGGFSQYIRIPANWAMKVTPNFNLEKAMAFGTAGFSAALSIDQLQKYVGDLKGKQAIVSGATGGLGSIAVAILNKLGCDVTALNGKKETHDFLLEIGARDILDRQQFEEDAPQNLLSQKWDIGVDIAGGSILSRMLKSMNDNGTIAATGMVSNTSFDANVLPFILRGVKLLGVNAESADQPTRQQIWRKMMGEWMPENFERLYHVITLDQLSDTLDAIFANQHQSGRYVIDMR